MRTRRWRFPSSRCWESPPFVMPTNPDPPHPEQPLPDFGSLTRGRFTYFPVVPGRVEFAAEVRQTILRDRPEVIAVELPLTLEDAWVRAVRRLPEISVLFYPDETGRDDQAVYVPIE